LEGQLSLPRLLRFLGQKFSLGFTFFQWGFLALKPSFTALLSGL
jgi:hypothetical protein